MVVNVYVTGKRQIIANKWVNKYFKPVDERCDRARAKERREALLQGTSVDSIAEPIELVEA